MPRPPAPREKHSRSKPADPYVALLRGVNVGGKNKLPMSELAELFFQAGCEQVRTYIQSGNVVFTASPAVAKRLPELVAQGITDRFGFRTSVIVRTAKELWRVAKSNPYLESDADLASLHVAFLSDLPDKRRVASLDPKRSPGDSFAVCGREIYLQLTNGVARTRLTTGYFDATLATTSTFRNWRTVLKLDELAQEMGRASA